MDGNTAVIDSPRPTRVLADATAKLQSRVLALSKLRCLKYIKLWFNMLATSAVLTHINNNRRHSQIVVAQWHWLDHMSSKTPYLWTKTNIFINYVLTLFSPVVHSPGIFTAFSKYLTSRNFLFGGWQLNDLNIILKHYF